MTNPLQPNRLDRGGLIKRGEVIEFSFNGRLYNGFEGDTLASALLANGVKVVSRSFKFHRPRGVMSAGVEESNAILGVDTGSGMTPVSRATLVPLKNGLRAESQNCFPNVGFDVFRILDFTRPLWPAGFYNKTFKWPNWHTFEPFIRRLAGLGTVSQAKDNTSYQHQNTYCDVLVVGAGPAGLQAALDAAQGGQDVLLVEQDSKIGGSLLHHTSSLDNKSPSDFIDSTRRQLESMKNVRVLLSSTVAGYYDQNVLTIHDRRHAYIGEGSIETFWKVRAKKVVLACGAIEQPLLFGNNDLPGIMLAGAVQKYARRYAVKCGDRVVGLVNNDIAWRSLLESAEAGVPIKEILDTRPEIEGSLESAAKDKNIKFELGVTVHSALGSREVRALDYSAGAGERRRVPCDVIAMSGGFNPTVHLYSQAGGKLRYDDGLKCFLPLHCRQSVEVVGAAAGQFADSETYNVTERSYGRHKTNAQWVDFQHDVTVSDIELAVRENYISVEHLKRYTTTGMSIDQGKTSNLNALTLLAEFTNRSPGQVGTTTFRPQFMPVTIGAIAGNRRGDFYAPPRRLAAHEWHESRQASFEDYGAWRRPAYYGDQRDKSIAGEALAVRNYAGIFDGSPLGKIEVKGADAADFLNRIYVNTVHTLKPGKVRYGLMLNENGVILDDGVFVRLSDDHFIVNTTSGNADRIAGWLEEWHQCEWPHLEVILSPVTTQWAVATVAGPNARSILQSLPGMTDLSSESFPHMSFATGSFENQVPYRIQRVSFSGECSYELSVPASYANDLFDEIWQIGTEYRLAPIGIEAILLLRTEKGFLHVGVDTDGTTNPFDVGFGAIVRNKKSDFVGARSLLRANDQRDDRRQLVGFELQDGASIEAGAHFVGLGGRSTRSEGFVTSAYRSPVLGKTIGLGLLERGASRKGEVVSIQNSGDLVSARIVDSAFYDPDGARMRS